ncbi:MAG: AIPR family protein, partial [Bacillota bacterium]|nr:AIPR family protein [Bacillota bacterium]
MLLEELEAEPSAVVRGDRFVQRVLRYRYQLSDDDSVNATGMAGSGDHGIDALIIDPAEDAEPPHALVVQGKYGVAGEQASPLDEFRKFAKGLRQARDGQPPTDALEQCAAILRAGGIVEYLIITIQPMTSDQLDELDDARGLANQGFGSQVVLEAMSLGDVYQEVTGQRAPGVVVSLSCQGVQPMQDVYIGAATLIDAYRMLREYADQHHGVLDSIYDRNVRKWLGRRAKSVNDGINNTLRQEPERFIAYNNGISIVCRSFQSSAQGLRIDSPQVVNGCQTTRTLYDFMVNHFAGTHVKLGTLPEAEPYRKASLAFKVIAVPDFNTDFVRNITRYSNKQNAVRGRDFLTLEEEFHRLKAGLAERKYFLEIQTGEYNVLPKAEKDRFPQGRLINAFDALRFYGAAVLKKPHTAFGRSGEFTPGGSEFDDATHDLKEDDLLVPWLMARHAEGRGYSIGAKKSLAEDDYRNQTRYFYLYMLFRVASQVLRGTADVDSTTRHDFY